MKGNGRMLVPLLFWDTDPWSRFPFGISHFSFLIVVATSRMTGVVRAPCNVDPNDKSEISNEKWKIFGFLTYHREHAREWHIAGGRTLPIGERTLVMGVLNVTPDSFSDGNQFLSLDKALAHAETDDCRRRRHHRHRR